MKKLDDLQFIELVKELNALDRKRDKAIQAKYNLLDSYGISYALYSARVKAGKTDFPGFENLMKEYETLDKIRKNVKKEKDEVLKKFGLTYAATWSRYTRNKDYYDKIL
jgi:hypothetical protein